MKSKQGEYLSLLLVSETFGNNDYIINIKGTLQEFRYKLNDILQKTKISDLANLCLITLNSEAFKVNNCNGDDNDDCQNMCDILPNIYGNENKYTSNLS